MDFFNRFFIGRYGMDKMGGTLFWCGIICNILAWLLAKFPIANAIFLFLSLLLYAYAIFRMLSRNFAARQRELAGYLRLKNKLKGLSGRVRYGNQKVVNLNAERKIFKHLTCPQCRQKLRVPRGKGCLRVTCKKCGCKFNAKS